MLLAFVTVMVRGQKPPARQPAEVAKAELVELVRLEPGIRLDIRYATSNNVLGRPVYSQARAFLQRPAAEALVRVHRRLKPHGYGLIVFDAYRPWSVTKRFYESISADKRRFFANPQRGSHHNRGCAVDLSLYELASGQTVQMPSEFDETTNRSGHDYEGGSVESRWLRKLLRQAMQNEGFRPYEAEWWHYTHESASRYPILNLSFDQAARLQDRQAQ